MIEDAASTIRLSRRALLWGGAAAAAATVVTGVQACGGPESTGPANQGGGASTLQAVIGYGNNQSWDPTQTASAFSMAALSHVYEGLLETDPVTREPLPGLVAEVPTDPTAESWELTLRPGATWHDGEPVTADDVVFTFDRVLDAEANVLVRSFFVSWLKAVEEVDAQTVRLRFHYPFAPAAQRLGIAKIMPRHVFSAAGAWDQAKGGTLIVGSGPYRVTEHTPTAQTAFARHEAYNGTRPATFETMTWFSIVDAAQRVARISGATAGAQIAENIPALNTESLQQGGRTVEGAWGMGHLFLMFNTGNGPLRDPRVRQALLHAIDTPTMIDIGLRGTGREVTSFLNEDNPAYQRLATVYDHDPDKARMLLQQAGASGLSLRLLAVNVSWVVDCLPTIIESWKAVGIDATSEPQDTAALFTKMDQSQDYQVVAAASNPNQFGIDADLITRYNYTRGGLWMKYTQWDSSPEAQEIFAAMDAAAQTTDAAELQRATTRYLELIAQAAVLYPVVHTQLLTAWDPTRLSGVRPLAYPGITAFGLERTS